jgi:hypothetical protein
MHAHVQRLVPVVKMATLLEGCTIEEQRTIVRFFCGQKDSMKRIFIQKYFPLRWELFVAESSSQQGGDILSRTLEIRRRCATKDGSG